MSLEEQLSNLVGLHCVVAKEFNTGDDGVSFSIGGVLECKSGFYRLNVNTVSFVSFNLSDVSFVQENRIELK